MTVAKDLTGRERMTWNVLASWAGHSVIIAAGFILPRMIDERLGQERLGVWDFAWSCVAYFGLVQGGVVSSINRYVAQFRAAGDAAGVNRVVSSVSCVLTVMAGVIMLLSIGIALLIPALWAGRIGVYLYDAQWAVFLLGLGIALEVWTSGYAGVLTGCHRWALHNGMHALTCVLTTSGMIAAVLLNGGLPALAAAHVFGEMVGRLLRVGLAYRVYPGLHVRLHLADWTTAREMLHFGGKSFIPTIGDLLLNQTISILVLSSIGVAALAVFSRSRSLVRQVDTLVSKMAYVLTPIVSSLQATQRQDELCDLFIRSTRYGVYIALPMILVLTILGGPLLYIWMGKHYAESLLLITIALGSLFTITQQPIVNFLQGLNAHARPGLANAAASLCAVGLAVAAVGPLGMGLLGVALAVSIPQSFVNGVYVPLVACHRVGLSFWDYLLRVWRQPLTYCLPFALCLATARLAFAHQPLLAVAVGLAVGLPLLAAIYFKYVLPTSLRNMIVGKLRRRSIQPTKSAE